MWGWLVGLGIIWVILLIIFSLLPLTLWIWQMVRLSKKENKTGLWIVLGVGLALFIFGFIFGGFFWGPLVAGIIGLFLGREEETKKPEHFWCGICHIKYQNEFLGGETAHEGKICRSCLGKKQSGEIPTRKQPKGKLNQEPSAPYQEEIYQKTFQRENREKRILLRELGRKQRKKNSYLTQFIINLAVGQWLLPLITYLIYWINLKEQIKVQALNRPGLGLATEVSFKELVKDFFKILTSETYFYGGHNIQISILWKIGILLAFLLPLGFWIYNLVRFLSVNGEVKQLEAEIKE